MKLPLADPAVVEAAIKHLCSRDPVIAAVIERVGPFETNFEPDLFKALIKSIIYQQISTSAGRSIFNKFQSVIGKQPLTPETILALAPDELRKAGLSSQKARYLQDVAEKVANGTVRITMLQSMTDEEVIAELTQITGVGVWTAQMLLIFSLGRPNIFPTADLGVRSAIKNLYRKRALPKEKQLTRFGKLWHPYATLASWYCWRSLDLE